jgi:DNA modification methylase
MESKQAIKEHPLIKVKIADLVFDPSNPNVMTEKQMHGLRASMQKYGYLTPVVIDENNKIADGEHRAIIYREMGYSEIPAIRMKLETEADRRTLRQVLNKLHGTHDKEKDSDELLHIYESQKLDELAFLIAQPKDQLLTLLQRYHPEYDFMQPEDSIFNEEDLTSESEPARTQLGDVYLLGNRHRLICADSTDVKSIVGKLLRPNNQSKVQPDMVFTDPPYNINFSYNEHQDDMPTVEYIDFCKNWFKVLKASGCPRIVITPGPRNITLWNEITEGERPTDIGTWYKSNSQSQGLVFQITRCEPILFYGTYDNHNKRSTDYFDYPGIISSNLRNAQHDSIARTKTKKGKQKKVFAPAKPLKLVSELIRDFTEPNNSVLDIFTGSGTTLIACEQASRTFYGCELDPRYCDLICKRYEKYTGKEVVKL